MIPALLLAAALLPSLSAYAQDAAQSNEQQIAPTAEKEDAKPAPQLVRLDDSLTKAQDDKAKGRLEEKPYQEFLIKFRRDLGEVMASIKLTPENTALHARILSRLGDSEQALAALGPALEQDPDSVALHLAVSQIHYDQKDYATALGEANAVLERDPANREALALKHFSDRRAWVGVGAAALATAAAEASLWGGYSDEAAAISPDFDAHRQEASPQIATMMHGAAAALRKGDINTAWSLAQQAMRDEPTSPASQHFFKVVEAARTKHLETKADLRRGLAAMDAGNEPEALAWVQKAADRSPNADTLDIVMTVKAWRDERVAARAQKSAPSKSAPSNGGPGPWPMGAAGAALGLTAWALLRKFSDNPNVRGPAMALVLTGTGMLAGGGVHTLATSHGDTDVGMYHTTKAPLLQDSPRVGLSPKQPDDCAEQLKKFYPQQQDAQQKRQGAFIVLQPILDKYGLSYEKFQASFPKLLSSLVATCDVDPAACQLMADKKDWAAAQASYGQIQALDQKLQAMSGVLAKLMDKCKVPGDDVKGTKKESGSDASKISEDNNAAPSKRETAEARGEAPNQEAVKAREAPASLTPEEDKASSRKTGKMAVLGPYPKYIQLAEDMGSRYFNTPKEVWDKMSPEQQWDANKKFLDRAIARNETFTLAINYDRVGFKSTLRKEIDYLESFGYRPTASRRMLVKAP